MHLFYKINEKISALSVKFLPSSVLDSFTVTNISTSTSFTLVIEAALFCRLIRTLTFKEFYLSFYFVLL